MTTESSYQKTSTGTTKPTTTLLLKDFVTHVLGQVRIIKKAYPGIMHFLIFWGKKGKIPSSS